ncbi:MarR family winged helix-turn-helix transcriptional regulator [Actinomyces sp. ZJ308]|uniref:MarR family winged helix-turn-helix transcriptional regulator n=1 Tax=Actinomyces sp. ZJ308 TaxID=2708342 RepID=UPI00142438AA|nr:MarR family winged helix-turn-helix transcriptional regulator [Actinomyces sp. ZJ308]
MTNNSNNPHPSASELDADDTGNTEDAASSQHLQRASLHERFRRLQHLMRRSRMTAHHDGPFADTTRGRGRVLAALRMQSPIPTRDLAFLLDIRQQSLNELLKKLQADGLIERRASEEDRRVMVVHLTEAGRDTPLSGPRADYLDSLTDEEAATLARLLDKIITSLESRLGPDEDGECGPRFADARRRMGEERFEAMMRMRERGFGPFGPGPAFVPGYGPGFGPEADDADLSEGRGRRGGRSGHGGPRRGGRPHRDGSALPGEDFPERGARRFRAARARRTRGARMTSYRFTAHDC